MTTQPLRAKSTGPACPPSLPIVREGQQIATHSVNTALSTPILLFGMPRSGTTWLGKIFDSHPETLYRHEPDSLGRLSQIPIAPELDDAPAHAARVRSFVSSLLEVRDTKITATLPDFPKHYLSRSQRIWNAIAIRAAKLEARLAGEAKARLWLTETEARRARLVWKSIESVSRLGVIAAALPEAYGILIIRHPCGYVASVLRGKGQGAFTDSGSIGEDLGVLEPLARTRIAKEYGITLDRLRNAQPAERLAWHWVLANDKALHDTTAGGRILAVHYEDLCQAPLRIAQQMFNWANLAPSHRTRAFLHTSTRTHESRYYSVYKDPQKAAYSWRTELPQKLQRAIMRVTADTRSGQLFL